MNNVRGDILWGDTLHYDNVSHVRKHTRLSLLFRTASDEKLGGAWERGYCHPAIPVVLNLPTLFLEIPPVGAVAAVPPPPPPPPPPPHTHTHTQPATQLHCFADLATLLPGIFLFSGSDRGRLEKGRVRVIGGGWREERGGWRWKVMGKGW